MCWRDLGGWFGLLVVRRRCRRGRVMVRIGRGGISRGGLCFRRRRVGMCWMGLVGCIRLRRVGRRIRRGLIRRRIGRIGVSRGRSCSHRRRGGGGWGRGLLCGGGFCWGGGGVVVRCLRAGGCIRLGVGRRRGRRGRGRVGIGRGGIWRGGLLRRGR